jgi:hypothetical protein
MKNIEPEVLIISNKFDFSTDIVVYNLNKMRVNYLRLNRDLFDNYNITFNPIERIIDIKLGNTDYCINSKRLKSIYFRAPTFLREIYKNTETATKQLSITQWSAFIRSLMVFDDSKWINNPHSTYKAENKPYQLFIANKIGFNVPNTLITNCFNNKMLLDETYALKTLDTGIVSKKNREAFIYTEFYSKKAILMRPHSKFPLILQKSLLPKEDIRVTIVKEDIYSVKIVGSEAKFIDWRKQKNKLEYKKIKLPKNIASKCISLVRKLDLLFGAIDMIKYNNEYYFIEINPTGEWAWLEKNLNLGIDKKIVELLIS